jgi:hypothetical protein
VRFESSGTVYGLIEQLQQMKVRTTALQGLRQP